MKPLTREHVLALLNRYLDVRLEASAITDEAMADYSMAVTHVSAVPDATSSYERLEFLGDSVLHLATTAYLYRRYASNDEGFMTRMRTHLINGKMLASLFRQGVPELAGHIVVREDLESQLARNGDVHHVQQQIHGRRLRRDTLEDVMEAFIGAIFLNHGFDTARQWVINLMEVYVDFAELARRIDSPRSLLNNYVEKHHGFLPKIEVVAEDTVRVVNPLTNQVVSVAKGLNRRDATDRAVRGALDYYGVSIHGCYS